MSVDHEYFEPGEAIEGEQVSAKARRIQDKGQFTKSGVGLLRRWILEGTVYCVLERPLRKKRI